MLPDFACVVNPLDYQLGSRYPGTEDRQSLLLTDGPGVFCNVCRHPLRKRNFATYVATRWCVFLSNLSELLGRETVGKSGQ